MSPEEGDAWYIPHHGVYHPHKPGKIRVVFDCSAKSMGLSLNSMLYKGLDLTNSLVGVLTRFSEDKVAVMEPMCQFFDKRGYPVSVVQAGHHRAQQIHRKSALKQLRRKTLTVFLSLSSSLSQPRSQIYYS